MAIQVALELKYLISEVQDRVCLTKHGIVEIYVTTKSINNISRLNFERERGRGRESQD